MLPLRFWVKFESIKVSIIHPSYPFKLNRGCNPSQEWAHLPLIPTQSNRPNLVIERETYSVKYPGMGCLIKSIGLTRMAVSEQEAFTPCTCSTQTWSYSLTSEYPYPYGTDHNQGNMGPGIGSSSSTLPSIKNASASKAGGYLGWVTVLPLRSASQTKMSGNTKNLTILIPLLSLPSHSATTSSRFWATQRRMRRGPSHLSSLTSELVATMAFVLKTM